MDVCIRGDARCYINRPGFGQAGCITEICRSEIEFQIPIKCCRASSNILLADGQVERLRKHPVRARRQEAEKIAAISLRECADERRSVPIDCDNMRPEDAHASRLNYPADLADGRGCRRLRVDLRYCRNIVVGQRALIDAGAEYASLSGSGSALYGLFVSPPAARRAAARLRKQGWTAQVTVTLGEHGTGEEFLIVDF